MEVYVLGAVWFQLPSTFNQLFAVKYTYSMYAFSYFYGK